jgi:hypothetical protein
VTLARIPRARVRLDRRPGGRGAALITATVGPDVHAWPNARPSLGLLVGPALPRNGMSSDEAPRHEKEAHRAPKGSSVTLCHASGASVPFNKCTELTEAVIGV